ncbi:unnamed protein product, partial [Ectocarpus sp. 8 AP-2014]
IARDDGGLTGLQIAGYFGCSGMVLRQILSAGTAVFEELKADRGTLAWYHEDRFAAQRIATATEYPEVVRRLFAYVNRATRALYDAVHGDDAVAIRSLVEGGAPGWVPVRNDRTLLNVAANVSAGFEAMFALLDLGCDPNVPDIHGNRPLHHVATRGHADGVALLIIFKADVEAVNNWCESALMCAARQGHESVTRVLLGAGADAEAPNMADNTALIFAARERHKRVTQILLEAGARWDVRNHKGDTAVLAAAKAGGCSGTLSVLSRVGGADVNAINNHRMSALYTAICNRDVDSIRCLLVAG